MMNERVMLRIGTASLSLGLVLAVAFEALHPAREHPNDDVQGTRTAMNRHHAGALPQSQGRK